MSTIRPEITGRGNLDEVTQTSEQPQARGPPGNDVRDAHTIPEFCSRRGLSTPMYYKIRKLGLGPREMRLGHKILISRESAARWRAEREAAEQYMPA